MSDILLTAYEPYDSWLTNVSQLVLEQLTGSTIVGHALTSRIYPVDFATIHGLIAADLSCDFDVAIHMGQAPGYSAITLEAIGVNVAVDRNQMTEDASPLVPRGPAAFQSQLPLAGWARELRAQGIPTIVSYHAGTYLCNAALYLSLFEANQRKLKTKSVFLHLPMAKEQVDALGTNLPSVPLEMLASAVRWILEQPYDTNDH